MCISQNKRFFQVFSKSLFFVRVLSCSVWYNVVKEKENNKNKYKQKGGRIYVCSMSYRRLCNINSTHIRTVGLCERFLHT